MVGMSTPATGSTRRSAGSQTRRLMRWSVGAGVAVVVLLMLGGGTPAGAAPQLPIPGVDCRNVPDPASPSTGAAAIIDPGPDGLLDGDPWAPGAAVSVYDVYGYAGLDTARYDPGCTDTGGFTNSLSNFVSSVNALGVAATVRLARIAFSPTTMSVLKPIQDAAVKAFGSSIFLPLIGVTGAVTGLWIMWRAHRADPREAASHASWAMLVTTIAMATIVYPITLGAAVDKVMTGAITEVNAAVTASPNRTLADSVGGSLHHSLLYQTWATGTFGRNGATATKYGPALFRAGAFTRAEQARINANPAVGKALTESKHRDYEKVAQRIKDADPQAYTHLAGHHDGTRLSTAGLAFLGMVVAVGFLLVAMARLLVAMVLNRIGIAVMPLISVLAQHPRLQGLLTGTLDTMASAVLSAVVFGCFAVGYIGAVINTLLSPASHVDPFLSYVIMALLSFVAWRLTRRLAGRLTAPRMASRIGQGLRGRRERTGDDAGEDSHSSGPTLTTVYTSGDGDDPAANRYQHVAPTEAAQRPRFATAVATGAAQGAIDSAALGMVTAGTVTMAGTAAGAAQGAIAATGLSVLNGATGSPAPRPSDAAPATQAALTAAPTTRAIAPVGAAGLPEHPASTSSASQGGAPVPHRHPTAAAVPVRLYEPGRQAPDLTPAPRSREDHKDVYDIYTPTPDQAQEIPA